MTDAELEAHGLDAETRARTRAVVASLTTEEAADLLTDLEKEQRAQDDHYAALRDLVGGRCEDGRSVQVLDLHGSEGHRTYVWDAVSGARRVLRGTPRDNIRARRQAIAASRAWARRPARPRAARTAARRTGTSGRPRGRRSHSRSDGGGSDSDGSGSSEPGEPPAGPPRESGAAS